MPSMPRGQRYLSDPTLIQVLSLYLLLLAFFVILFNISKVEQFKTTVVTDSLNSTFAGRGQNTESPERLASAIGSIVTDPRFQRRIGDLIRAEFPVAEVREIKPGTILEARVPIDSLFSDDDVAPDLRHLTESLALALDNAPPGVHYDVNFLVGIAPDGEPETDRSGRSIAMVRAGRFAARLVTAGAPAGHVAAGLEQGDPKWARLLFYVRGGSFSATTEVKPVARVGAAQ